MIDLQVTVKRLFCLGFVADSTETTSSRESQTATG